MNDPILGEQIPVRVKAGTFGLALDVSAGLTEDSLTLTDPSGRVRITIPAAMFPFLAPGDSTNLFLNCVKVSIEPPKQSALEIPGLVIPRQ